MQFKKKEQHQSKIYRGEEPEALIKFTLNDTGLTFVQVKI